MKGASQDVLMSSNLTESATASHRIPSLPLIATAADPSHSEGVNSEQQEHQDTMYLAFEAPVGFAAVEEPVTDSSPSNLAELVQNQQLELAANRAELARQQREQEDLQRALRLREKWLQDLRSDLKAAQEERRSLAGQLAEARASLDSMHLRLAQQDEQIKMLESDAAERMGKTIFPSERVRPVAPAPGELLNRENPSKLQPLDDQGTPIVLDRKVMTVGRTRENHVFVPSQLVSRDHARVLVNEEEVVLFDVGSANGCFVNDQQVKRRALQNGDIVRFADRKYRFCA
jgi:hypothetical protein